MPQPEERVTREYFIGGSAAPDVWRRLEELILVETGVTIIRDGEDITLPPQLMAHQDFRATAPQIGARAQDGTRNWTALVRAYEVQQTSPPRSGYVPAAEFPLEFVLSPEASLNNERLTIVNARLPLASLSGYISSFDEYIAGHGEKATLERFCPKGVNMGIGVVNFCRKFVEYKLAEIIPPDA